jgi:RNA polymerase sigma-70 factor (ECF subfamily)
MAPETIVAFQAGEPDAIRDLYRTYGRFVYSVAHRVVRSRGLAEEATQETFVKAWRSADRFEAHRDPAPWLATIARRTAMDVRRREDRRPATTIEELDLDGPGLSESPASDAVFERDAAAWAVRAAIEDLPEVERETMRLQHLHGLSHEEIAARAGVPIGTVKSRSHRAHRRLASALGAWKEGR